MYKSYIRLVYDVKPPALGRLALRGRGQQFQAAADPQRGQLLLHAVLGEALGEGGEVDLVEQLVLVEAREDVGRLACLRVDVRLQALRADFFHHALHRAVDGADGDVRGLQVLLEDAAAGEGDGGHHLVRADGDDPIHIFKIYFLRTEAPGGVGVH